VRFWIEGAEFHDGGVLSLSASPAPALNRAPQPDRAQRPADAGFDRLHLREHEHACGVQQRLGHVERTRREAYCQIEQPGRHGGG
jgi:hypothetical protein